MKELSKRTSLITMSIGSGSAADVQLLFAEDILGDSEGPFPRHSKQYCDLHSERKKIENKAFEMSLNNFYICSISSKSIIYKGLYLAQAISDFYLDLRDKRFVSRYAIFCWT